MSRPTRPAPVQIAMKEVALTAKTDYDLLFNEVRAALLPDLWADHTSIVSFCGPVYLASNSVWVRSILFFSVDS